MVVGSDSSVETPFFLYPIIRQELHVKSYEEIMSNISIKREHIEQGMDLLKLWRAPPLSRFSPRVGEKTSLFLFQIM